MQASSDALGAALDKWTGARRQLERARVQWMQAAASSAVPPVATALMRARVNALEAEAAALFEEAMEFMERRPLGP